MNKTFDLHRLGLVMRWDILGNWKHHASALIGLAVGTTLFCLIMLYNIGNHGTHDPEATSIYYLERVYGFFITITFIAFYVMASCIFTNMKTKQKREGFLILPASNLEKFISRLLLMLAWAIVSLIGALIIADFIQFISSFFLSPGFHQEIAWPTIRHFFESVFSFKYWERATVIYSFLLFVHSFFTLGGAFYRKLPVLLTPCTGLVLCIVFGYICNELAESGLLHINFNHGSMADYCLTAISTIVLLALSAFNYWASYKIFTHMQVICNKWINL